MQENSCYNARKSPRYASRLRKMSWRLGFPSDTAVELTILSRPPAAITFLASSQFHLHRAVRLWAWLLQYCDSVTPLFCVVVKER